MRDVHPITLFWFGIGASFVCNFCVAGFLFSFQQISPEFYWQATIALALFAFLFLTIPVFGGMAIVALIIYRQPTREWATKCLVKSWLACFLIFSSGVIGAYGSFAAQNGFWSIQFALSLEIAFVAFMLCVVISQNLLLRYFGLRRDRSDPNDSKKGAVTTTSTR